MVHPSERSQAQIRRSKNKYKKRKLISKRARVRVEKEERISKREAALTTPKPTITKKVEKNTQKDIESVAVTAVQTDKEAQSPKHQESTGASEQLKEIDGEEKPKQTTKKNEKKKLKSKNKVQSAENETQSLNNHESIAAAEQTKETDTEEKPKTSEKKSGKKKRKSKNKNKGQIAENSPTSS